VSTEAASTQLPTGASPTRGGQVVIPPTISDQATATRATSSHATIDRATANRAAEGRNASDPGMAGSPIPDQPLVRPVPRPARAMQDTEDVHAPQRSGLRPAPTYPAPALTAAGDLLRALAAPVRIAIVLELRESPSCVHDLVAALGVTQPLISQHLRVLKSAGVVAGARHGREVVYRLVDEHLAHIVVDAVAHVEEPARKDRG
jgi:ArsR family transcriptional regulator